MTDANAPQPPDEQNLDLESMMDRLQNLDPSEMTPENLQKMLGGAKLGDVVANFQQQLKGMVENLAEQQGMDLSDLDDDDDDGWFDGDDDYPEEDFEEALFDRSSEPDGSFEQFPGSRELWEAAIALDPEERLEISVEMKSPPVTSVEKAYYHTCHYRLLFEVCDNKVTFRDVTTPRQDYLHGKGWPAMLNLPRKSWPDLEILIATLQVEQYNLREAFKTNHHERIPRPDLMPFAKRAITAGLAK